MASPSPINSSTNIEGVRSSLEALIAKIKGSIAPSSSEAPVNGTSGDDTLDGTDGGDQINGRAGDDAISGLEGDDSLDGGSGDDAIDGGEGDDWLRGGSGDDQIAGGEGDDEIKAGSGDDRIEGGEGDDAIATGSGADRIVIAGDFGSDTITDFKAGTDVIDLTGIAGVTSLDQLTFTETKDGTLITGEGLSGSILVKGVTAAELKDGASLDLACYLAGTMIQTPAGERPIEALDIGDEVATVSGAVRRIRWIGRRSFATRFLRADSRKLPVRIAAGALGEDASGAPVPKRGLIVSPGHSLLIDGVLVNADLLIDSEAIRRHAPGETVDYLHLELDTPDAIIADGAASETYVNDGNRRQFENWESYVVRYGVDHPSPRDAAGRVVHRWPHASPEKIAAIRLRIAARAAGSRQAA